MAEVEEHFDCIICAESIDSENHLLALSSCVHNGLHICSICCLRIRSVQGNLHCPSCKVEIEYAICTKDPTLKYSDFEIWGDNKIDSPDKEVYVFDNKSKMFFPKDYYYNVIKKLFVYQCPVCHETKRDYKSLRGHVFNEHQMQLCVLCAEFKQIFPSEHVIYSQQEYDQHVRHGTKKSGFNGHPNCEFCRKRFYDSSALFIHLSRDHYTCHICDKQGIKYKYYHEYKDLEQHFRTSHFLCEQPACIEKRFVAFSNEIEMQSHMVHYHPTLCTQVRTIPMPFKYRRDHGESVETSDKSAKKNGKFEGGLGGEVSEGEWQVEIQPGINTVDPRDPDRNITRETPTNFELKNSQEEFPELISPTSGLASTGIISNRWMNIKTNTKPKQKKSDFPNLPQGQKPNNKKVQVTNPNLALINNSKSGNTIDAISKDYAKLSNNPEEKSPPGINNIAQSLNGWGANIKVVEKKSKYNSKPVQNTKLSASDFPPPPPSLDITDASLSAAIESSLRTFAQESQKKIETFPDLSADVASTPSSQSSSSKPQVLKPKPKKPAPSNDLMAALKSVGIAPPPSSKKSSGLKVVKSSSTIATDKLMAEKKSSKSGASSASNTPSPPPPPSTTTISTNSSSTSDQLKNYGGWVKIGGMGKGY